MMDTDPIATITGGNMEVTPQMREAVRAQEAAEAKAYRRECNQRWADWMDKMQSEMKTKLRTVLPDLTDDQFDEIDGMFSDYYYELNR